MFKNLKLENLWQQFTTTVLLLGAWLVLIIGGYMAFNLDYYLTNDTPVRVGVLFLLVYSVAMMIFSNQMMRFFLTYIGHYFLEGFFVFTFFAFVILGFAIFCLFMYRAGVFWFDDFFSIRFFPFIVGGLMMVTSIFKISKTLIFD